MLRQLHKKRRKSHGKSHRSSGSCSRAGIRIVGGGGPPINNMCVKGLIVKRFEGEGGYLSIKGLD